MAGGATTAPTAVPALISPMAVDRSRTGNHSATALVAAGKPPPSPAPSRKRLAASIQKPVARPWLAQASDQKTMMTAKPAPRAEPVDEHAAAGVHQRIGEQEHRRQRAELGVRERDVFLDGGDGHRQRLAIEIADRDGDTNEHGDPPSEHRVADAV